MGVSGACTSTERSSGNNQPGELAAIREVIFNLAFLGGNPVDIFTMLVFAIAQILFFG